MKDDPFKKLIVDESEANTHMLADLLEPFVVFVKSLKSMEFLPAFRRLPNDLKVLVVLAASKAKANIFSQEESMSPKDIIDLDIAPEGSIKTSLKRLSDGKEIRSKDKKYYLPNYRVQSLSEKLDKQGSQ